MKVAIVTGPCRPGECGVGDYATCLVRALNAAGAESAAINSEPSGLVSVFGVASGLAKERFDIVHIQYPTLGFRTGAAAQTLSMIQGCVVTIHEASQRHILRKLSLIPFAFRSMHVIFTSESERQFATRWIPWISRKSSVIPIASNIRKGPTDRPRRVGEVVYFGLIIPGKGLDQVVELSQLAKSAGTPFTLRILGQVPSRSKAYYETLRSQAADLPVQWTVGLTEEEVSEELSQAYISYLPYPDGASERRATLKAMLLNGVAVVTTRGAHTPSSWETAVKFCQTSQQAFDTICALMNDRDEITRMAVKAFQLGQSYSWEYIAQKHLEIYRLLLHDRRICKTSDGRF